jgi:hypothetical protein
MNMLYYLQAALEEASQYRRFAPSARYTWDFTRGGEGEKREKAKPEEESKGLS